MDDSTLLAERFEQERSRLRAVAYRMLGSSSEADDAVQEAWLRASRAGTDDVENLPAWLTTVVTRICLNLLRTRAARREEPLEARPPEADTGGGDGAARGTDPEQEAVLAESVGLALLVVLDTLTPTERVAFVLHDLFAMPFDEIGPVIERSPAAARQLASRARRRVKGGTTASESDLVRQRRVVEAFLAASRGGDFQALVALLDPDVVLRADRQVVPTPEPIVLHGSQHVAEGAFAAAARVPFSTPALVNGSVGLVMAPGGWLFLALAFTVSGDRITAMDVIADPERLRATRLGVLDGFGGPDGPGVLDG
ncbi:RNA polymerase sigma-70 factor, ECF subfamily [Actinacidiphila yanglinensis]|uniref:RNA polymerase sigma-70 factor, ECF subfamily n=1 Tax=Actinacidiphila yanglinensis TaxID=310779 RepID=A0A1H6DWH6_9ACTN|nr:sigma-70 family RNA polymerase sigma factor [Actinacidiphila yanglinensis]SEG89621.1 RNA polymerase sigma-70 factor, ECF subfamily [Actinacidiphila yanglinensis]